jgi:flagellar biosynthesis/type III secretory pathway protein FliH
MRGGDEPGIIERWKQLASEEPDHTHRTAYAVTVTVFAELTGCAAAWRSALEDWNMQESTLVAEWTAAARAEGRAEGHAEGRAEGRAEGHAEGRAEGLARGEQRALIQVLAAKFGTPVPPEVVQAIEAQTDPEIFSRWLSHAIAATSLDAFRDAMGRG